MAIDGKVLRRSFDGFHDRKAAHILSAFATDAALVLAHADCDEKSNEIPAVQTLLSELGLAGAIVDLGTELFEVANANVISDIAAAADAARAAATTARVNIDINVVAVKDPAARSQLAEQTDGLEEKVILAADSLVERVRGRILS